MSFADTINDMMKFYFLLFVASIIITVIWVIIQLWKDKHRKFYDIKDDFNQGEIAMSKAEKFIQENIRDDSNIVARTGMFEIVNFRHHEWLTPDQARKAVEIAKEETLQEVKRKLLNMLQTSIDDKHFFEQLDDYIKELENKQ